MGLAAGLPRFPSGFGGRGNDLEDRVAGLLEGLHPQEVTHGLFLVIAEIDEDTAASGPAARLEHRASGRPS